MLGPAGREARTAAGAAYALLAYTAWGLLPAYWKLLLGVPPAEVLSNRVLFSVLVTFALLAALGRFAELRAALRSPRERRGLALASVFIAVNWGVFIWSVQAGRIVETSLGYFLNPLINAALGVAVFGEHLRRLQWLALALAAFGVGVQVVSFGAAPWIALVLGATFSAYGVAKKRTTVPALTSLAFETAALAPLALAWLAFAAPAPGGALATGTSLERALLIAAGPVTALPLVLFAAAAQRLSFIALGLFQYLSPTLSLVLAVLAYGEPFTRAHAISFACIWLALAAFTASAWHAQRNALPRATREPPNRSPEHDA
jgi:chloramphenicol-sensitive protein RarD